MIMKSGQRSLFKRFVDATVNYLENFFERFGLLVGRHPFRAIFISLIFALVCCAGLLRFTEENRAEKLWVEQDSDYIRDQDWVRSLFPVKVRQIKIMFESKNNVLTPAVMKNLYVLDQLVKNLYKDSSNEKLHWTNITFGLPNNLLELWAFDYHTIYNLSTQDILLKLNELQIRSETTGRSINLLEYISGVQRNSTNHIVGATIVKSTYFIQKNDVLDKDKGQWLDDDGKSWEIEFERVLKGTDFPGVIVYYSTWESYIEAGFDAVGNDLGLIFSGYALIIVYAALMLGKFSRIQHKVWLAVTGVLCVVLSVGVSFGLCSAVGIIYGPVHSVLPFLLLGIGVDDIFVIIQSWDNIDAPIENNLQIAQKISKTMKHAGVAITVTSVTDIFALLIGATTVLPGLRSFCVYAAVGIAILYVFATSFFVAFLTIDARRQKSRRDACLGVKLSKKWIPLACANEMYFQKNMKFLSKGLLSHVGKVSILLITFIMLTFGSYGISQVVLGSDPNWFLPPESDEGTYRIKESKMFSEFGEKTYAYIGNISYFENQDKLSQLSLMLSQSGYIVNTSIISWYDEYIKWMTTNQSLSSYINNGQLTNKEIFSTSLLDFIRTDGSVYENKLMYEKKGNAISIHASRFTALHIQLYESESELKAMDDVRDIASTILFSNGDHPVIFADIYINWETNRIIGKELLRNLILAAVCVFIIILLLIVNVITSLTVLCCVAFTIIDMCGFLHFWDVKFDFIVSTSLVLALGFTVDYAAHIGHAFMTARGGDRNQRAQTAFVNTGPAVFNGGFSTFLAFVLLAFSESSVFKLFFKVLFLVVSLGLFHGLLFLPVVLSIIGPAPYSVVTKDEIKKDTQESSTVIENPAYSIPLDKSSSVCDKHDDINIFVNGITQTFVAEENNKNKQVSIIRMINIKML